MEILNIIESYATYALMMLNRFQELKESLFILSQRNDL